jgi:hypothetical protein
VGTGRYDTFGGIYCSTSAITLDRALWLDRGKAKQQDRQVFYKRPNRDVDKQEQQMQSLRLGQSLAVAVVLSLTLLIAGMVGLGVGIHHGDVVAPEMNVSLSGLRIVAYTTDPIECRPYLPCLGPSQDYYVVGVYRTTAPDNLSETGHWILTVPLQR